MDTTDIIYNYAQKLDCDARRFEPMSRHTSFKIGGKADVYIKVTNLSQLMKILKECDACKEKYILLGNGSNVLVPDEGIHGTVLRLDGDFRNISLIDDTTIYCGAGAALGSLCKFAQICIAAVPDRIGICMGNSGNSRRCCVYERRRIRR